MNETMDAMVRRTVRVTLDDELLIHLDARAESEGTSRSELLRRGARASLRDASDTDEFDRELQAAYPRIPQDLALVAAAERLASMTAPEW
jgi:metal-responsive CopG/Arc/MetJ family transcriptional regulator